MAPALNAGDRELSAKTELPLWLFSAYKLGVLLHSSEETSEVVPNGTCHGNVIQS